MTIEPITLDYLLEMLAEEDVDPALIRTIAKMAQAHIANLHEELEGIKETVRMTLGLHV